MREYVRQTHITSIFLSVNNCFSLCMSNYFHHVLFISLTYLIICNIIRMFKLFCLITSVEVQTKFVNHRNLEGNCIYIFIVILSFNKIETTPIFYSHSCFKKNKQTNKLGWVGCPLPNRTGREKLLLKLFRYRVQTLKSGAMGLCWCG